MTAADNPPGSSALRILRSARPEIDALRSGPSGDAEARGLVLRLTNVVDRALRRMLRDDEAADLNVRLSALAPDELRADAVLAELRRNDRLSVELAAGIHELLETRRRLESGAAPTEADRARAVQVAGTLEGALVAFSRSLAVAPAASPIIEPPLEPVEPVGPTGRRRERRRGSPAGSIVLAIAIVLAVLAGAWWYVGRTDGVEMRTGVALFEQGEYEEAAQHFWRYAQSHPDDATPHLYLARIHRRMNRPELAAGAIREAELIAPDDPAVRREEGFLLLDTGRADAAVDRFRQAIALDESSSEAWVGLVRALRESGRGDEAERAIREAPAEARALLTRSDSP